MPRKYKNNYSSKGFVKKVKAVLKSETEKKHRWYGFTSVSVPTVGLTPVNTLLNGIAQGSDQTNRIGNKVKVCSLYGDFFFTGSDSTNSIRVILYIPKESQATLSCAFNDPIDQDSFTVLSDSLLTTSTSGNNCKRFRLKKNFARGRAMGITTTYDSTTSAITSISKNPLYLYFVSDSAAVSHPFVNGYIRVYYTDI